MNVYKYPLRITDTQLVSMPKDAKLLDVQMQGDQCCLWALVRPEVERVFRKIAMYGTGHPTPEYPGEYLATFQMAGGTLVFHVFDLGAE